ncbi:MAG: hypothetical protein QOJ65_2268 [Fimbriimonadaceae bacterium]|jgi:hypothetical protein|nr:hypothetical protein [Fimbriimonadaceae bacterium]
MQRATATGIYGDWVTIPIIDTQGRGSLHLHKNGTYTLKFQPAKQAELTGKGKFKVANIPPPGSNDEADRIVYLSADEFGGKKLKPGQLPIKKLGYYSHGPVLTDGQTIAYCHPGDEERVKKLFSAPAAGK